MKGKKSYGKALIDMTEYIIAGYSKHGVSYYTTNSINIVFSELASHDVYHSTASISKATHDVA